MPVSGIYFNLSSFRVWIVRLILLHARVFLSNNKLKDFMTLGMNILPLYSPQITS
jgi:hypothetical protein